jgi:hypothetical protein
MNGSRVALGRGIAAKVHVEIDGTVATLLAPLPEAEIEVR